MIFTINIATEMLNSQDGIGVILGGLPYAVESVPAERLPFKGTLEVPERRWRLFLDIHFRGTGEIVRTAAEIDGPEGLDVGDELAQVKQRFTFYLLHF